MPQPPIDSASKARPATAKPKTGGEPSENDLAARTVAEHETDEARSAVSRDFAIQHGETSSVNKDEQEQPLSVSGNGTENRLHVASLLIPLVETLLRLILPAIFASLMFGPDDVIPLIVVFVVIPSTVYHALRYFTLRYEIADAELVVRSGLVFRRERRIPFGRVQEVILQQSFLHRVLKLAKLEITTAGSDAQEADLNVLSMRSAEALKETIVARQREASPRPGQETSADGAVPDFVCQLSSRDLVLGGLTSKLAASLGAAVAAIAYFQLFLDFGHDIENQIESKVQRRLPGQGLFELTEKIESQLPDTGALGFVKDMVLSDTMTKSISLAFWGLLVSVVAYVIRYHGFRLTRYGDVLSTSHGLLTLRRGSLPRDRIQALKLEEGLLRRWFGLASVRVDSAGDRNQVDDNNKRDVLVPVAAKRMAHETARQAIPGLTELEPHWRRISPRAVMRGSKKGWLLTLAVLAQTYGFFGWFCLIWLPAIPLVYFLNYQWYRHAGYWFDREHFLSRKGWLNQATVCLPIKNIQNVSVIQSYFDRRLNLATLSIDAAGQANTGGGPLIRHLPIAEARGIQQELARRAADCQFAW